MINYQPYKNKSVVILGLGRSNICALHNLEHHVKTFYLWDDSPAGQENVKKQGYPTHNITQIPWTEIDFLIISPGIAHTHPKAHPFCQMARKFNIPITGDIEILYQTRKDQTISAITGTNGKSTTTSLVGHLFSQAHTDHIIGGNLGFPVLDFPEKEHYILELSSYQIDLLDETKFQAAALLNITPDHLTRHGGFKNYAQCKGSIFSRLHQGGLAAICIDTLPTQSIWNRLKSHTHIHVVPFSTVQKLEQGLYLDEKGHIYDDGKYVFSLNSCLHLQGRHNGENTLCAYAIARFYGLSQESIFQGLQSFQGLSHRQEWVGTWDQITFINDSKATNAQACSHALSTFENIYWIVGGRAKEDGLKGLEKFFPNIKCAYLIGESEEKFSQHLQNYHVNFQLCQTLENAVHTIMKNIDSNEKSCVLLSPACASQDQFDNFEIRGNMFKNYIRPYINSQ